MVPETLMQMAERHYYWVTSVEPRNQDTVFAAYLALAAAALWMAGTAHPPCVVFAGFRAVAIFCAWATLVFCLDGMRGRESHSFPALEEHVRYYIKKIHSRDDAADTLVRHWMELSATGKREMNRRTKALRRAGIALFATYLNIVVVYWAL